MISTYDIIFEWLQEQPVQIGAVATGIIELYHNGNEFRIYTNDYDPDPGKTSDEGRFRITFTDGRSWPYRNKSDDKSWKSMITSLVDPDWPTKLATYIGIA